MNMEQAVPNSNFPMLSGNNPTITMSSREIADLCEKRHDNVMADINKMLLDIGIDALKFQGIYLDAYNREKPCFNLPKDLTVTLITGYRADLRYKVVKRLEQLEGQGAWAAIDVRNPNQLALIASQLIEVNQEQAKQIEAMQVDVSAHERLSKADGSLNITEAAKNLAMRPKELFDWLSRNDWIYKRAGSANWLGYQTKCNQGLLEHKSTTVKASDGSDKIAEQVRVTAKGLSALAKLIQPVAVVVQ